MLSCTKPWKTCPSIRSFEFRSHSQLFTAILKWNLVLPDLDFQKGIFLMIYFNGLFHNDELPNIIPSMIVDKHFEFELKGSCSCPSGCHTWSAGLPQAAHREVQGRRQPAQPDRMAPTPFSHQQPNGKTFVHLRAVPTQHGSRPLKVNFTLASANTVKYLI